MKADFCKLHPLVDGFMAQGFCCVVYLGEGGREKAA